MVPAQIPAMFKALTLLVPRFVFLVSMAVVRRGTEPCGTSALDPSTCPTMGDGVLPSKLLDHQMCLSAAAPGGNVSQQGAAFVPTSGFQFV